ncbi:hypothetical protein Ciccas_002194 [Cichlidogyrus casuarinus]|uniref:Hemimethylated DNA-binding domain-containing protein n=1 Tax=Cichlidogyrus casuarinus TaxID=1844966 RepID=A0ABD2QL27_9PLAT
MKLEQAFSAKPLDESSFYGASPTPRKTRPNDVKFHVGELVVDLEKRNIYVVMGWDHRPQAPTDFLPSLNLKKGQEQPFYRLLPFKEDSTTYLYRAQEALRLETLPETKQEPNYNPKLRRYFSAFDGTIFIANEELRQIYPFG